VASVGLVKKLNRAHTRIGPQEFGKRRKVRDKARRKRRPSRLVTKLSGNKETVWGGTFGGGGNKKYKQKKGKGNTKSVKENQKRYTAKKRGGLNTWGPRCNPSGMDNWSLVKKVEIYGYGRPRFGVAHELRSGGGGR